MADEFTQDGRSQVEPAAPDFTRSLFVGVVIIAGLYVSREVLVPIALAVLLSFVLAIPVGLLQRLGLGRVVSVVFVVLVAFTGIFAVGGIIASQFTTLAGDLPRYQSTIREKVTRLRGSTGAGGPIERITDMVQDLGRNTAPPAPGKATGKLEGGATQPIPVEITPPPTTPLETIERIASPLLGPLATTGLVAVFVIFMLLQRGDLRNRFIRLVGSHDLQRTTAAMNDAARRLSRLFLMQVLLNSVFGIIIGTGLWLIGVPSPVLWGIIAAISRFIPYVGALIAAACPLVLAAAVDPNWTMLLETAALFLVIELLMGQVVEPLVYGHSTGLSPVAVIVSVTFWTWLWGPVGLLLATPLTVCLVVIGRHVERMEFLDVMLGDRPPLTEIESFYQRMLAGDPAETTEQAETYLKEHSLSTYYDEVALKGLALAQADAARGSLDDRRLGKIDKAAADLIDNLSEQEDVTPPPVAEKTKAGDEPPLQNAEPPPPPPADLPVLAPDQLPADWRDGTPILCIAGRSLLDRVGASMLAQLLAKHGLPADVEGPEVLTSSGIFQLDVSARKVICLSYLDTSSPVHVRYAVRRLRRKAPGAAILLGSWGLEADGITTLCEAAKADLCAPSLRHAVELCLDMAQPKAAAVEGDGVAPIPKAGQGDMPAPAMQLAGKVA